MTGELRARTRRLDPSSAPELLAFAGEDGWVFERDGVGLAMRGPAVARLPVGDVSPFLASIDVDDPVGLPGCGPVAVAALPFDPASAAVASAVVPSSVLGRAVDGTCWLTVVGDGDAVGEPDLARDFRSSAPAPDGFTLTPTVSHADWCELVGKAVAHIADGAFSKVVLAREVVVEASSDIVVSQVLARLQALYPSCTVFSCDGFVGASPELLVSRFGPVVTSHPLAGTIAHSGDVEADRRASDRMLGSAKERAEHQLVVEAVAGVLAPLCSSLSVPDGPSIVALRNVAHLGTLVTGTLSSSSPPVPVPSALDLALALHPTPAVGGTPTDEAVAYLRSVEGFDRGRYAGPVGWVDARGDGAFVVGIRSAEIAGRVARLFAGVGVVEGSDPDEELAETQLKLQALLAAVVRP